MTAPTNRLRVVPGWAWPVAAVALLVLLALLLQQVEGRRNEIAALNNRAVELRRTIEAANAEITKIDALLQAILRAAAHEPSAAALVNELGLSTARPTTMPPAGG